jgi:hypothetical protein
VATITTSKRNKASGSGLESLACERSTHNVPLRRKSNHTVFSVRRYSHESSDSPGKRLWKSSVTTRSASNFSFGNIVSGVFTPVLAELTLKSSAVALR